jgi:hypothetical protein
MVRHPDEVLQDAYEREPGQGSSSYTTHRTAGR